MSSNFENESYTMSQVERPHNNLNSSDLTVDEIFSSRVTLICQWIIFGCVCQLMTLFGIGSNIINITCFIKQGFTDPVNISLTGLALADLGCLITLAWTNICSTPAFAEQDLPFDTIEFQYLTSGMPNTIFTRITGWITAIITLERCLCIIAPLKIKQIVTPKRVCMIIISIFLLLISSAAPLYTVNKLDLKYYPSRNKTLLGLVFTEDRAHVETISFVINNVLIPVGSFTVIIICTIKLVSELNKITKWRMKCAMSSHSDNVTFRNQKVAKMVVMISFLFIACFIPISITFVVAVSVPGFSIDGQHKNVLIVFAGLCFLLESINSSTNIFIYYHMSSNYRDMFHNTFCSKRSTNNTKLIC